MFASLKKMAAAVTDGVERRLFAEYGAIFVTTASPPPAIVFRDEDEVLAFQISVSTGATRVGEHVIELQAEAMEALSRAASALSRRGYSLSARSEDSGRRSYAQTVGLWNRNVRAGLDHWRRLGRIGTELVERITLLPSTEQVAAILALEESEGVYFGTFFDRSILSSVAAPGASQHLSMLAFDVLEHQEAEVEDELAGWGWFRTVPDDLPHFTYLGLRPQELEGSGLVPEKREHGGRAYEFWVPDPRILEE